MHFSAPALHPEKLLTWRDLMSIEFGVHDALQTGLKATPSPSESRELGTKPRQGSGPLLSAHVLYSVTL